MSRYNAVQKVVWGRTRSGKIAVMGRRTAAHLDATIIRLRKRTKGTAELQLIQSAYNTGVDASAGTHDLDAALDVEIVGMDWDAAQAFLRKNGWAAWFRHPPEFPNHIHMISLGYEPAPVGIFVPGQVRDYENHAFGLKDQHIPGSDKSWFPPDIDATMFHYRRFIRWHPRWNRRHPTIP